MLCPVCNAFRLANTEPCPQCKAPSPLSGEPMNNYGAMTSPPDSVFRWDNPAPPQTNDNSLWAQVMTPQSMQTPPRTENNEPGFQNLASYLPVPYHPNTGEIQPAYGTYPLNQEGGLVPAMYNPGALAPALPDQLPSIHIPPMYTKPRPIIPRYRAISGFLSVLIVFTFLCTAAGYYAKASGKLTFLHQIYGDVKLKNIHAKPTYLPVPSNLQADYGPASIIINSATTASKIDYQTAFALVQTNTFQSGEPIFLTYSVHPKSPGAVTFKWYTNNRLYQTSQPVSIQDAKNGYTVIQYPQPVEGKVELYWNNQLAIRIYFVVQ